MSFDPSDEELMLLYQHGNDAAGAMLFDRYQRPVFGYILRILRNRSDAEEVVQNVFLRMHECREQYRCDGRFRGWIFRIATTQSYNFLVTRTRDNGCRISMEDGDSAVEVRSNECNPCESLQVTIMADRLEQAIENLPVEYRTIFLLRQKQGLSYEEISNILKKSEDSLRVQFHRARKALYQAIKPWLEEE